MPKQILNSIISETTKSYLVRKRKLVANFDVGPESKKTKKQANLEEEKYQMKSHPALNIELKKKKKTRQIEMTGSRKLKWPEVEN